MKTTKQFFKGWSWDSSDLLQCKQACLGLLLAGVAEEIVLTLDFGQLWVEAVIEEFNHPAD